MDENEEIKSIKEEIALLESEAESHDLFKAPEEPKKDSILKLYREILHLKDSIKTGNLSKEELGVEKVSFRGYQRIGLYAESQGLDLVAAYFRSKGEITVASSMSKDGTFIKLLFTSIKQEIKKILNPETKDLFVKFEDVLAIEG